MVHASCHCGAIALEIDVAPQDVTECNCSICRRYGVLWAYYSPSQVQFTKYPETDIYMWDDKAIQFHRCRVCGCISHWSAVDPSTRPCGQTSPRYGCIRARRIPRSWWRAYHIGWRCDAAP
jgi:hypothetical protein